ncbi:MAG: anthranilate phosphoribosyltransferase [Mariprofundus sp.]|nr:anthranilate phosphoribosyltransferase [Mariprofundus sp.]
MNIASMIKRVARGRNGAENLNQQEAASLFDKLLLAEADPLQLGAFLIAQRMKGETAAELAGFVEAARLHIALAPVIPPLTVDLPCYAGKCRAPHAYLKAAINARDAGIPVFVHGVKAIDGRISAGQVLQAAGVACVDNLIDAADLLHRQGIVYVDLSDLCPDLFRIYTLRERLGVRSFANSVARLLNPMACAGQLNGFFHTPYADYMAKANVLLGQPRSLLFMGAEGEPELYADRQKVIKKQQGAEISNLQFKAANASPYARESMDLSTLQQQSELLLAGKSSEREDAVIKRMGEAFAWAAHGYQLGNEWREEI